MQTPDFSSVIAENSLLLLTFCYLMNLNVMTVKVKVTAATDTTMPVSAG